jgi:hypothetical protein
MELAIQQTGPTPVKIPLRAAHPDSNTQSMKEVGVNVCPILPALREACLFEWCREPLKMNLFSPLGWPAILDQYLS